LHTQATSTVPGLRVLGHRISLVSQGHPYSTLFGTPPALQHESPRTVAALSLSESSACLARPVETWTGDPLFSRISLTTTSWPQASRRLLHHALAVPDHDRIHEGINRILLLSSGFQPTSGTPTYRRTTTWQTLGDETCRGTLLASILTVPMRRGRRRPQHTVPPSTIHIYMAFFA
jgi:hypothetical protein